MVVDTTHCLVAGAILLGKEELNIVSWTGYALIPALRGNQYITSWDIKFDLS